MAKKKPIPRFESEDEEREFWATHDSTEYVDWAETSRIGSLPNLTPATKAISLRLPEALLADLKTLARMRDVPYQSLMKLFIAERVRDELRREWEAHRQRRAATRREPRPPRSR